MQGLSCLEHSGLKGLGVGIYCLRLGIEEATFRAVSLGSRVGVII